MVRRRQLWRYEHTRQGGTVLCEPTAEPSPEVVVREYLKCRLDKDSDNNKATNNNSMLLMGGNYRLSNPTARLTDGRSLAECNKLAVYPT